MVNPLLSSSALYLINSRQSKKEWLEPIPYLVINDMKNKKTEVFYMNPSFRPTLTLEAQLCEESQMQQLWRQYLELLESGFLNGWTT